MSHNRFGKTFTLTTFGESHGPAIGVVIDGVPPGIGIDEKDFRQDLNRRATGKSRHVSQRKEPDNIQILSGVFDGKTTGTSLALLIENQDARSKDYSNIAQSFRPGHADYTYFKKYGLRDYRGGGRSSARETTMRVAAGVLAKKILKQWFGTEIWAWVSRIGPHVPEQVDRETIEQNDFYFPDAGKIDDLTRFMDALRKSGDSIGAEITVQACSVPAGLGEPVYGKFDADVASALMSINAVKGVEIGDGFASAQQLGTEHRDEMTVEGFLSNHSGGVLGGITTGQDVLAKMAVKPTSSLRIPCQSINTQGEKVEVVTEGRHDPCVGIRAVPIAEAMLAIVMLDHVMRDRAQNAHLNRNDGLI